MENELKIYGTFIKEIKELIYRRQYEAMKMVNKELMQLYWEIGEEIVHKQKEQGWGKSVIEILSRELQLEFPGVKGFSATNLWRMRGFYLEYSKQLNLPPSVGDLQKTILPPSVEELGEDNTSVNLQLKVAESSKVNLPPLVAEISWSKNCVIIEKCKDPLQREFYIKMTKRFGWTKDVLINNIENRAYEKYLTNQTNFDATVPEKYRLQAKLAVKDDYNFEFIEMGIEHSEAELETGITKNVKKFLREMGGYYTYIGDQYLLNVTDEDYHIDLLLFHRELRCLIAIDLKIGEFKPEYAGKMLFYLSALDNEVKLPHENPSIGIIICKSKDRTRVEYTLNAVDKPIGVATYSYYDTLPEDMRSLLPSPDKIASIIDGLEETDNGA